MSSKPHILILGSLNTDLVTLTPRIPQSGETLTATSFTTGPGGKGANQAVGCARSSRCSRPSTTQPTQTTHNASASSPSSATQSSKSPLSQTQASNDDPDALATVSFLGAVGSKDLLPLNALAENGVSTSAVQILPGVRTGTATILVEEDTGENRIMVVPGANARVTLELLQESRWRGSLLGGEGGRDAGGGERARKPDLLVMQLEIPLSTVVEAVKMANEGGLPVLLNPTPVPTGREEKRVLEGVLGGVEWLVVNEGEAEALAGVEAEDGANAEGKGKGQVRGKEKGADRDEWLNIIFSALRRKGAKNVVITLGGDGAAYSIDKLTGWKKVPAARVEKVVDTTAAGDTFVGAFAVEIVTIGSGEGAEMDVGPAVTRACTAAARTVEREGAISSIPWRYEWGGE